MFLYVMMVGVNLKSGEIFYVPLAIVGFHNLKIQIYSIKVYLWMFVNLRTTRNNIVDIRCQRFFPTVATSLYLLLTLCFQQGFDFFTSDCIFSKTLCVCVLGRWEVEELKENAVPGDKGLVLKSVAKYHAISAMLTKAFVFDDKPLIVQ